MKCKRRIKGFLLAFFLIIGLIAPGRAAHAEKPEVTFDKITGEFTFTTIDTKATTNIRWNTIGFTVCREPTQGYPRKDTDGDSKTQDWAYFDIKKGQKDQYPYGDGVHVKVTFKFDKDQVNAAFKNTKLDEIKDNDIIYFNGVFDIIYNGTEDKEHIYYNLSGKPYGIATAAPWNDTKDFDDRFDLSVLFHDGDNKYPITIERRIYSNSTSTLYDNTDYPKQKKNTTFSTSWHNVTNKINTNGKEYYLYRLYYTNLRDPKKIVGNRKTSVNPYLSPTEYKDALSYLRDREYTIKDKGLKITAMYRRFTEKPTESGDSMEREFETIDPTAVIKADTRGNEAYDVLEGIPGTESLYANAITSKYLSGYRFKKVEGTKLYPVTVTKTYTLTWKDKGEVGKPDLPHSDTRTVPKTYYIERKYSYWYIDFLGVYGLDKAIIENDALPGKSITLTPSGYKAPTVSYTNSTSESDHITEPKIKTPAALSQSINGGYSEPSVPDDNLKSYAEAAVDKILCKNDKLLFNGQTMMSDTRKEEAADMPIAIPEGTEEIGENVLYKSNLVIPGTRANEAYESTGIITYKPIVNICNREALEVDTDYEINDVNPVVVHTPVVCDGMVQDNRSDNQMITPDAGRASLVLDRPFYVTLPTTGMHRDIQGYGYRDYGKYIASRQVKFAFDTYKGSSTAGTFIPKDTWTGVAENTLFYVPAWVTEGRYEIRFRSTAINAAANDGYGKSEDIANISLANYVAEDSSIVQISGRIYGLNIYDVTDYPIWEKVFRLPNSLKLTGFHYTVGVKNQNGESSGQNPQFTITMVNGSHPNYKNQGILKTGYMTRFSLTTVGSMADSDDYVRIKPKFYFADKDGKNRREADIYYTESFNGKEHILVKMGGNLDLENDKSIKTGDPYLGIPESELQRTAYYEGVPLRKWKSQTKKIYNYMNIMLPFTLRTFIGFVDPIPQTVTEKQAATSVQHWYGEYYLPAEVHIVPKGYDVSNYALHHGGLDYHEKFWLKEGYIIVNFDITTVKDGELNLSYINAANSENGYCNMWKREGYQYRKTSYHGISFNFQDGDYVIYYANHSVQEDYISSGTH
ncbi:hypothetical protein SAMN02745136_04092 [Anaerocolumna jejuensis DSM 15929]|uniref:DUF5704 domain-containing protein n=1 Tax=Anaerocolumna jejuensis DSM 15929 TaxID=1121322 RepID=A0A1M6XW44_9FIRM|nr:DUF5704 domain-containing protein [Anaerocolumna jejuensis]SHL10207.1 hypothetical protein SAMN02745136_04092 [Anaerocolumna jejuensis DSM 15929]